MAPKSPPKKSPQKSQSPKKSPQKSPKKSVKKGKEAVADEILPPPDDISKLDESALTELAKSYRLDSLGNKTVILDRIIRFLKTKNLWKSKQVKKKRGKKKKRATGGADDEGDEDVDNENEHEETSKPDVVVEVVPEVLELDMDDPALNSFSNVFSKFHELSQRKVELEEDEQVPDTRRNGYRRGDEMDLDEEEANMEDPIEARQSKKKLRKLNRMTVAQLKQMVEKPEVVDWVDATSSDPLLLVTLKTARNTIPVPGHWSKKSAYLSGKRGYEKPPFELPEYIKATGIMQLRQTNRGHIGIQAKAKERAHPKLGRLDIDYQKLHDAFFRFQTKPTFSSHGDVYFEGREFDSGLKQKKPGVLSEDLKLALNIPPNAPPPWLINMQRYGPPPSYPQLQIPGLNAPIPEGAQWGFHPGGWGKPPTDEYNRPLYGDVFASNRVIIPEEFIAPIESTVWGELEEEEYEEEEEEEEDEQEEEEEQEEQEEAEQPTVEFETGKIDIETDHIELRKDAKRPTLSGTAPTTEQKSLYTVLSSKAASGSSKGFMSSTHTYSVPGSKAVEVTLNPEDLESGMDNETLKRKFEESVQESSKRRPAVGAGQREDFSELVNEHAEKQSKKKNRRDEKRDFKF